MLKRPVLMIISSIFLTIIFLSLVVSGCQPASNSPYQNQPIEIVSVKGPLQPINPGGPIVEIILKNVAVEPVISLTATLELAKPFDFIFDITPVTPLMPGKNISKRVTLIQGGFSDTTLYPLTINATVQSGDEFIYTKQVQIIPPASD